MKFSALYPKIEQAEIDGFEEILETSLPRDYVDFLLEENGGEPELTYFTPPVGSDLDGVDVEVSIFYGFGPEEDQSCDIVRSFLFHSDVIPKPFIPIGDYGGGDRICIGIHGEYRGKIYDWCADYEKEYGEEPDLEALTYLAPSFSEFIKGLKASPSS